MWDGGAHEKFPHLFLKGEVVELIAIKDIPLYLTDDGEIGPFKEGSMFKVGINNAKRLVKRGLAEPTELDLD